MVIQDNEYDCCYCTLANLLKFIGRHCKYFHNITHERETKRETKMIWIDNEGNYHFESFRIQDYK